MSDTCSSTRVTYSTDWSYTVFMLDAGRLEWIERHKYVIKKKWNIHDRSQKQQMFCCKKEDSFSVQCTESDTNNITTYSNTNGYLKTKSAHTLHQKLSHGYVFFWGGCPSRKFIFKGFVSGLQIGDSLRTRPYANIWESTDMSQNAWISINYISLI